MTGWPVADVAAPGAAEAAMADEAEYAALSSGDAEVEPIDQLGCGCVPVFRETPELVPHPRRPGRFVAAERAPGQAVLLPPG
ncbi:hypothetical protein SK854_16840 [Lentzea sp. BCCO 10_0061]|uniref:Uncharacterized protein n=1 Tax=Lentzea sokolovensis TaxID=3095429 RepID=A0ABU4UYN3_9PSEU|nr:hypothetical protein [Lentzea sp. BCCO 10_0061]MDX8143795.1 hypothetical protein [Lentzea sp. BCCO 10_0061]